MMGHLSKDRGRKGKGNGKGGDGYKGYHKDKGKMMKGAGKKGSGIWRTQGRTFSGIEKLEIPGTELDLRTN